MNSHERSTRGADPAKAERRQYVNFAFYKVDPAWRRLPASEREEGKRELMGVVEAFASQMIVLPYSTIGLRADVDFLLWRIAYDLELFQEMTARLLSTGLGRYLDTPYSLLSMTKRSVYVDRHQHEGQEGTRLHLIPGESKYLFIYPFVKTREWYRLSKSARQGMMNEHIDVGHRYASVKLNTTYSFGLDDQEFVVAFETDKPDDFLDLVMELRETEASRYTQRDTPIFTGVAKDMRSILDQLGG